MLPSFVANLSYKTQNDFFFIVYSKNTLPNELQVHIQVKSFLNSEVAFLSFVTEIVIIIFLLFES